MNDVVVSLSIKCLMFDIFVASENNAIDHVHTKTDKQNNNLCN